MAEGKDIDNDIAYSAVMNVVFSEGALQQLQQTLQSTDDPVKALANMIYTTLATARDASQGKIDLAPSIWLKPGGVVDRVTKDVCQIAASMGVQGAETPDFGVQVKREVVATMKNEGSGEAPQGDPMAQQASAGMPPQAPPAGLLAQAQGGM